MKFFLGLLVLIASWASHAGNDIVSCKTNNKSWQSIVRVDADGRSEIRFKKKVDKKYIICPLKIKYLTSTQGGLSPDISFEFERLACDKNLKDVEKEIFKNIYLVIDTKNKKVFKGRLQWLKKNQPEDCAQLKVKKSELRLNIKKWEKGLWGNR